MMLPEESGTLPHRPWTPMSPVNGRSPQAKRCGRDEAKRKSVRKRLPLRGSRCVCNVEELAAPVKLLRHHREAATAREGAKHHREATPQRKARHLREEQPAEPAPSGRATCRTSTIGTSNVPNQQHRDAQPAEPTPSRSSYRQGRRTAHREATPQRKARHHREATAATEGAMQHRDEQPAEPAASGRATCRTSTIGKRMFWQIMVPKGQVLRG